MARDSITYIKGAMQHRKDRIRHMKIIKTLSVVVLGSLVIAGVFYRHSQKTVDAYYEKEVSLNDSMQELEEQKVEVENQKQELQEETERILSEAEIVAQNNERLIKENINLQNTLLKAAATGVKPQNYTIPEDSEVAVDYNKLTYIGEFEGTAYTPSPEECSNNLGLTASGKAIVPGVSIAVDTAYWKLGTKFYIEGIGYVVAMDTGNAVKGKYRFDYAVFDRSFALKLGRQKWNVYLVNE